MADKPIICCGTVIGTPEEIKIYIEKLWQYKGNHKTHGVDQATHQYIFYNNLLPIENLIEIDCTTGAIFTSYLFNVLNPIQVKNNMILRGDGGVPAVVHQYDRHQQLVQLVDNLYREKIFQADENFTDIQSALDQVFCLVQRQNWSTATKFFIDYVFYAEDLNSYSEKLLKLAQFILQRYNPDAEILFSAAQTTLAIAFSSNIDINQMEKIYNLFIQAENFKCVNSSFKFFVKSMLINFTDVLYRNNQQILAREYIKRLADWRD